MPTNRLAGETSPYLLQHAHNPVDWSPWDDVALARAKAEDRPIFLSIGYAACHWCHVMERESFEDEATAAELNRDFVPIKVDREERPDLDQVYMGAVQAMTGQGGWPMSVFLTPGRPAVLRRDVLPRRAAPRDAVVPTGAGRRRPGLSRAAGGRGALGRRHRRRDRPGRSVRGRARERSRPDRPRARARPARCPTPASSTRPWPGSRHRSTRVMAAGAAPRSSRSR